MTREEIIKGLESVKTECGKHLDEGFAWICKPIDEAIETLKREPCTDAVSREAVLKSLCELGYGDEENGAEAEYMYALRRVADKVKALPPVTLERPKGEWKLDGHAHIYCTACNQTNVSLWKSDFCPICGSYNGQI